MARILIDKLRHSYVQNPQKPDDYALKEMSLELADVFADRSWRQLQAPRSSCEAGKLDDLSKHTQSS